MFREIFSLLPLDSSILIMCFVCPPVPGVPGGIENMLEDDFLYPGDPGKA
jgi:hypothetical protein